MTVEKQFSNSLLFFGAVVGALRARFSAPSLDVAMDFVQPRARPVTKIHDQASLDQAHYARLLDHELERKLFTEVEREDTDTLNRVRAALYEA